MNNRRKLFVLISTGLWAFSTVAVIAAVSYLFLCNLSGMPTAEDLSRAHLYALAIGFLPWIFAYARHPRPIRHRNHHGRIGDTT